MPVGVELKSLDAKGAKGKDKDAKEGKAKQRRQNMADVDQGLT
jgi:hypothetical protein